MFPFDFAAPTPWYTCPVANAPVEETVIVWADDHDAPFARFVDAIVPDILLTVNL